MKLLFLELPVFLLFAGKGKTELILSLAVFFLLILSLYLLQRKKEIPVRIGICYPVLSLSVNLVLSGLFYRRWVSSQRMISAAGFLRMYPKQACLFIAFLLALLALPGMGFILGNISAAFFSKQDRKIVFPAAISLAGFIGAAAMLMLFLNSRSSPFYVFDDWVDPNTMLTVGKGVLKGYVPYRDLYEQKGPMLVFIHTIGAIFSFDSLHGVWALQVISGSVLLFFVYKTVALFQGRKSIVIVPLFAVVLYTTRAFGAGDTAEEFSIPFLMYAAYTGCKAVMNKDLPSKREFLLIGITSGFIFWMKYSIVGLYIGWFLYFLIFSVIHRRLSTLLRGTGLLLAGVLLSSLPVFLYFLSHSALDSLFQAYFYNNMFYYGNLTYPFFRKMQFGLNYYRIHAFVPLVLSLLGILWIIRHRNRQLLLFVFLTYSTAIVLIYFGGMTHGYTSLPLCIFCVFGFTCLMDLCCKIGDFQNLLLFHTADISAISLAACLLLLCGFSQNQSFLEYEKEDWFPFKMLSVIEESGIENPSILCYYIGDIGVNTVAGLIPGIRYFCDYHNPNMTEIYAEQNECIQNQCVDFLITQNFYQNKPPEFETYEYKGTFSGAANNNYSRYYYYVPAGNKH